MIVCIHNNASELQHMHLFLPKTDSLSKRIMSGHMQCQPQLNEKYIRFFHYISSFKSIYFLKEFIKYSQQFFCLILFYISFESVAAIFHNSLELHSALPEKKKMQSNRFTQTHDPRNRQSLVIEAKVFC